MHRLSDKIEDQEREYFKLVKTDTTKLLEIVGIFAVIISMIFVAYEIRQSNKIATATMTNDVLNQISESNQLLLENEDLLDMIVSFTDNNLELTAAETFRADLLISMLVGPIIAAEEAYRNGVLPRSVIDTLKLNAPLTATSLPGWTELWKEHIEHSAEMKDSEIGRAILEAISETDNL